MSCKTPASLSTHARRAASVGNARIASIIFALLSSFNLVFIPLLYRSAAFRTTLYVASCLCTITLYIALWQDAITRVDAIKGGSKWQK